jgi:hypothetical protein
MKVGRNAPCPCGSGKKYKQCCGPAEEARDRRRSTYAMIGSAVLLVLGIGGAVFLMSEESGTGNRVWSAEHGHWHDASGRELGAGASVPAAPTGPAPAGKVWSAEHGHWHDAP